MVVLKSTWKNGTMGEVQEGEEVRSGLGIMDVIDLVGDAGARAA